MFFIALLIGCDTSLAVGDSPKSKNSSENNGERPPRNTEVSHPVLQASQPAVQDPPRSAAQIPQLAVEISSSETSNREGPSRNIDNGQGPSRSTRNVDLKDLRRVTKIADKNLKELTKIADFKEIENFFLQKEAALKKEHSIVSKKIEKLYAEKERREEKLIEELHETVKEELNLKKLLYVEKEKQKELIRELREINTEKLNLKNNLEEIYNNDECLRNFYHYENDHCAAPELVNWFRDELDKSEKRTKKTADEYVLVTVKNSDEEKSLIETLKVLSYLEQESASKIEKKDDGKTSSISSMSIHNDNNQENKINTLENLEETSKILEKEENILEQELNTLEEKKQEIEKKIYEKRKILLEKKENMVCHLKNIKNILLKKIKK